MNPYQNFEFHPSGLLLELSRFPGSPGWRAGFTTRKAAGNLPAVLARWRWEGVPILQPRQVHGPEVLPVRNPFPFQSRPPAADGLATGTRGVMLAVAVADCLPLLLFDPVRKVGAALHAGWRGSLAGIAERGLRLLQAEWGCRPGHLHAVLGPCIGTCCYRVGSAVRDAFEERGYPLREIGVSRNGAFFLDLRAANRRRLLEAGLPEKSIRTIDLCTRCRADLFPSYRREGAAAGRFLGFIGSHPEV